MFTSLLILAFIALIGNLIYQILRYLKVKTNAFSRKEIKDIALEKANQLSYEDPEITCDYCGCKINTLTQKVCPNCGAAYHKDEEWVLRHGLEEDYVDETTDALIAAREQKANLESEKIIANIKKTILILVVLIGLLIAVAVLAAAMVKKSEYRQDEELNEYDYETYTLADYEVRGDGVIYNQDDVTITIKGFYISDQTQVNETNEYPYDGRVRVAFQVDNCRDEDVSISMSCSGVNGLVHTYNSIYTYDKFQKHKSVLFYENFYKVPYQQIEEMAFDRIAVTGEDYSYHVEIEESTIVKTTVKNPYHPDFSDRTLLYSDDRVDVYGWYGSRHSRAGYRFAIVNKSGEHMKIRKGSVKVDGVETDEMNVFYQTVLPKDYTIVSSLVYDYGDEENELVDRKVEVNFSFDCPTKPTLDFATGYLDVSSLDETMVIEETEY